MILLHVRKDGVDCRVVDMLMDFCGEVPLFGIDVMIAAIFSLCWFCIKGGKDQQSAFFSRFMGLKTATMTSNSKFCSFVYSLAT